MQETSEEITLTFKCPVEIADQLKSIAKDQDLTVSQILRRMVKQELIKNSPAPESTQQ